MILGYGWQTACRDASSLTFCHLPLARLVGSHGETARRPEMRGLYPNSSTASHTSVATPRVARKPRAGHMTCLAASAVTPPAARPTSLRLLVAVAAPSPWRSVQPHRALWRREGAGPRAVTMLPRCSSAGDSRAAGDGSLSSFCIIEGPETIQDFVQMQSQEIQDNIKSRRNKIFLLMEEVRRLRVQQRIRAAESRGASTEENEMPEMPSTIPFLPYTSPKTMKQLYLTSFSFISGIIMFGGLIAPILELKLGLGGTSYEDFIRNMYLPLQLSQVDPIVASFSGGAVGVISALMLVEVKNVRQQEKKRCTYCHGTGYLPCARCSASKMLLSTKRFSLSTTERCSNCSGAGKVMCPTCLCTGMAMASEHDPRIDPFD